MNTDRGPNDLEEIIDKLQKQVTFLQSKCRQAGQEIQELKKYKSECIRLENLLHGYKKVIEELSRQVAK